MDHMRTFGCIAYAKVSDSQRPNLRQRQQNVCFLDIVKVPKAYRLMLLETKKIIRSRDVNFCKDSRVEGHLDNGHSGRSEGIVDQSYKFPIIHVIDEGDGDEDGNETKKGLPSQRMALREPSSLSNRHYLERVRRPPSKWWKNHIFTEGEEEHANVALLDAPLTIH